MADRTHSDLPWDALYETEGEVPWEALQKFASALQENPDILEKLGNVYDDEWSTAQSHETYVDLYIPAIIALAASDGGDVSQEELDRWGQFLIDRLLQAGEHEDDIGMEATSAACGTIGPKVLPLVLEKLDEIEPGHGAWFHIWGLSQLATDSQDMEIRDAVTERSKQALTRALAGDLKPLDVMETAWTLAYMGREECVSTLRKLAAMAPGVAGGGGDIGEAADYLEGNMEYDPLPELWERHVREWLPERVRAAKRWYEMDQEEKTEHSAEESLSDQAGERPCLTREPGDGPIVSDSPKVGRNDPCPCGSGRKYKHCCGKRAGR